MTDDIDKFLASKINKYSATPPSELMNRMYTMGMFMTNHKFDMQKLISKIENILDEHTASPIGEVKNTKREWLINSLLKGIEDGSSETYRNAYDETGKYQMTEEMLRRRAEIDRMNDRIIKHLNRNT